ncbi:MAG: hypothetical protein ACRCU0_06225 [Candidatus Rhabdochlamydia sp.]
MLKKSFRICSLVFLYMVLFGTQKIIGSEPNHKPSEESLGKHFHVVSQEDLYLDDNRFQININGTLYPVCSLEKIGTLWVINLDRHRCS